MKKLYLILNLLLFAAMSVHAQKQSFDSKYIKVGVMSNEWPSCLANNPNIRNLGTLQGESFDQSRIGKQILDVLFQRDTNGLHMDRLYNEALQNTTIEEFEVALKDVSADTKDILKREIAHQLLKNNYIIIFRTEEKRKKNGKIKIKKYWSVYHVDINDRIIEQAYQNWRTPNLYDQIQVSVQLVARGKVPTNAEDSNELVYDIAKKVPAFAVRGPLTSRYPFIARMGKDMGVKNMNRIYIYRFKETADGELYSKKVCTTRATNVTGESTRMYMISGRFPSTKKGDIAVVKDRHRSSISLLGQGSLGNDKRIGAKLQYEHLMHFSKSGIAQYILGSIGYNRHEKEPYGIWWDKSCSIQPTLNNANFSIGYGLGLNFLGRMELMPYITGGVQCTFITGGDNPLYYWDNDLEQWPDLYRADNGDGLLDNPGFIGHAGAVLNINIWYPVQLSIGADYNYSTKPSKIAQFISGHKINRVNLYAGLRFHF